MNTGAARAAVAGLRRAPLLLAAPAVATVGAVLLPLAYLLIRAASGGSGAWSVLELRATLELVLDTALLVAGVVMTGTALAVPLAWLVVRTDLPGRRFWTVAAALPLVVPSYVAALVLLGALGPRGLLQQALEGPFGIERLPDIYGYPGALLALTLATYPYVFLLAVAALRNLDPALEEAARALGRGRLATFARVTLPALRPSVAAGALLAALYTLADFGAVAAMQYHALTRAIYLQYQALFDRTAAAVLALVLVVLTALVLALEARVRQRGRHHRAAPGARRPAPPVRLGRWRWPALAFCGGIVSTFLALPVGVLLYWAVEAIPLGRPFDVAWRAAANSLVVSALAAAVATAAVLPVAYLAQRHPARWTRLLERLAFTSNALPGIVIALSLVFFAARYATPLYQTLAILVFAYVVRFAPQALAAVGASLRGVDPRVEEAARGLGLGPPRVLVTVTARLASPGLLVGAGLVFLSTMKELPATLLLRPIGFETLATEIWSFTSLADYPAAAPSALLLLAASAPVVLLLVARRETSVDAPG